MEARIVYVDSFADKPFAGNPAIVCLLPEPRDTAWLQLVASELNPVSEIAFLHERADGYNLRWFTRAVEVELCGHATLASAHVLWEEGRLASDEEARFYTLSGLLTARRDGGWIEMDFPAEPAREACAPPELVRALGTDPLYVGKNRFDYLVEVESEAKVLSSRPDIGLLKSVATRGVIVTSRTSSSSVDFVSRFFAPAIGIDEDPVTGSAHCCLGPYWRDRLGKTDLVGFQASARGGLVRVHVASERVRLAGRAVTVMRGELALAEA